MNGDSLFRYPPGQSVDDFSYPNHMPDFLQDVVDSASPQLVAACSSDPRCIYDTVQTGDQNIGLATMDSLSLMGQTHGERLAQPARLLFTLSCT